MLVLCQRAAVLWLKQIDVKPSSTSTISLITGYSSETACITWHSLSILWESTSLHEFTAKISIDKTLTTTRYGIS